MASNSCCRISGGTPNNLKCPDCGHVVGAHAYESDGWANCGVCTIKEELKEELLAELIARQRPSIFGGTTII